jgi:leucyl aminopeptidase
MKLTFISDNIENTKCLHIFLCFDPNKFIKEFPFITEKGVKINYQGNNIVYYEIDKNTMFYTCNKIAKSINKLNENNFCIYISNIDNKYKLLILQLICKQIYKFDKYKTKNNNKNNINLYIKDLPKNKKFILDIIHQINITNLNRNFQNESSNIIYPESFVKYAINLLGKNKHLKINVLDNKDLKKQGFNLIHDMGKSSNNEPKFMIVNYLPDSKYKTICFIGKTVCFDTGGVNLKQYDKDLYQMKSDKTGGCTVISIIKYIIESNMKINIIGLLPIIDNSLSGNSINPGDIVKSYGNKTVEILNTDAEGRLIMADAFDYSNTLKNVDYIFDLATLTSSAEYYHCDVTAAILTLNTKLKNDIENISEHVGERVYFLPPWLEYMELSKSQIANVQNNNSSSCSKSGAFMASMFLANFVPKNLIDKWVHFDITHIYTDHFSNGNCTILLINLLKNLS